MHLENILVMYRIYNAETLEKLVKTVHVLIVDNYHVKLICRQDISSI